MIPYTPGDTLLHRLDPRTKLGLQIAFAIAAYGQTTPGGLAILTLGTGGWFLAAELSPLRALKTLKAPLVVLLIGPVVAGISVTPPDFVIGDAVGPALASYRVVLILLVTVATVRSTALEETQAAIQRLIPGRAGEVGGVGVGIVGRFFPLLKADLRRTREASKARLGTERPLVDRMRIIAVNGLNRMFKRADRLAVALRARCFAWNRTGPRLEYTHRDYIGWVIAVLLVMTLII